MRPILWLIVVTAAFFWAAQTEALRAHSAPNRCAPSSSSRSVNNEPDCDECHRLHSDTLFFLNAEKTSCVKATGCPGGGLADGELKKLRDAAFLQQHSHAKFLAQHAGLNLDNLWDAYEVFCGAGREVATLNSRYFSLAERLSWLEHENVTLGCVVFGDPARQDSIVNATDGTVLAENVLWASAARQNLSSVSRVV